MDAISCLCLLFADKGQLNNASRWFKSALKYLGQTSDHIEALIHDWDARITHSRDARVALDKEAGAIY